MLHIFFFFFIINTFVILYYYNLIWLIIFTKHIPYEFVLRIIYSSWHNENNNFILRCYFVHTQWQTTSYILHWSYQMYNYDTLGIGFWLEARNEIIQRRVTNKCRWFFFFLLFNARVLFQLLKKHDKVICKLKNFRKFYIFYLYNLLF